MPYWGHIPGKSAISAFLGGLPNNDYWIRLDSKNVSLILEKERETKYYIKREKNGEPPNLKNGEIALLLAAQKDYLVI